MNIVLIVLLVLIALFAVLRAVVIPNAPAKALGVTADGTLQPCPATPNCVSSQTDKVSAYVAPLSLESDDVDEAMARVRNVLPQIGPNHIVTETPDYLHAVFVTPLMGYRDDVEFLLDRANGVIHIRSASRLGRKDFDVNRTRVEAIRSAL
ncbi:MAG: DUF1499 domain-containing protein [Natronospirillum sp.]